MACKDVRPGISGLIVVSSDVIHNAALGRDVLHVLSHLRPGGVMIMSDTPRVHCPSCCNVSVTELRRFYIFHTTVRLLGSEGVRSLVRRACRTYGTRLTGPGRRRIGPIHTVCGPFAARRVGRGVMRVLHPRNVAAPVRLIFRDVRNLHRTVPGRGNS